MEKINDYTIIEKIGGTFNVDVYRARQNYDDNTVVIKVLKPGFYTLPEVTRLRKEFDLIKKFDCKGIIQHYSFLEDSGKFAVVMEDFNGIPLNKVFTNTSISLKQFLEIAIELSETIGYLHKNNIVHQNINPNNILINKTDRQIKISNCGLSTHINRLHEEIYDLKVINDFLAYVSPEQTGRINHQMDYRTDLYSLGITFFEILTGKLPFMSPDPMEVIHAHIAKKPVSPDYLNPRIPSTVSNIILKLMSKTAEERYQNSYGLMSDLKRCFNDYELYGEIKHFELGNRDISLTSNSTQKLYGRNKEITRLKEAYRRTCKGETNIILVSGNPGIGKTALICDIQKTVIEYKKGAFISGKYEELTQGVPYSAITKAFQGLIKQILSEKKDIIDIWKERLIRALSPNEAIIAQVIPEVTHIIGPQQEISDIGSEELKNRFFLAFQNFIKTFARESHPLIIFFDDVHWSDRSSLELISTVLGDMALSHLMVIMAFRDNDIKDTHMFIQFINEIKQKTLSIQELVLTPLSYHHVNGLILDCFKCQVTQSKQLANLVIKKTGGNPFFIHQFMRTLQDRKLLSVDTHADWQRNFKLVRQIDLTDNVVDLLSQKIEKLPKGRCELIKIGACIGHTFDLERLSVLIEQSMEVIWQHVKDAINEGYIEICEDKFRFQHDRIREAAYHLIPEKERIWIHYRIGKYLLEKTKFNDFYSQIFYIADQVNHIEKEYISQRDGYKLASLNHKAGEKAISSAAYSAALVYLEHGIRFLGEDNWCTEYNLSLKLYESAIVAACLSGEFDKMHKFKLIAIKNTKTILDQVTIYEFSILAFIAQNNFVEAVNTGLDFLKQLGIMFPKNPTKRHVVFSMTKVRLALRGKKVTALVDLPEMKDPKYLAVMRIISRISTPAFNSNLILSILIELEHLLLSIKYGNTPDSAVAYSAYAVHLCSVLGDFDNACKFGDLALNLIEKFNAKEFEAQVKTTIHGFVKHWKYPAVESLLPLQEGYRTGKETGTLLYCANCLFIYCGTAFLSGKKLSALDSKLTEYIQEVDRMNQGPPLMYLKVLRQTVLNLSGKSKDPCQLIGDAYDESELLTYHQEANDFSTLGYIFYQKMILGFIFGNLQEALKHTKLMEKYFDGIRSSMVDKLYYLYSALVYCEIYPEANKSDQKQILKKITQKKKKIKKYASHNPDHMQFSLFLITAEQARIMGGYKTPLIHYEKALNLAREDGMVHYEALVNEVTAKFYIFHDQLNLAVYYIREARSKYNEWGAKAKVHQIDTHYAKLLAECHYRSYDGLSDPVEYLTRYSRADKATQSLDLSSVIKISETIFGEIVLSRLLKRLMSILIESAGAEKGFIVFKEGVKLIVEAEGNIKSKRIPILNSIPVENHGGLSYAVVSYTARFKETVLLNNAASEGAFTWDTYIVNHKCKSILCMPILNQGRLSAILYLENNLINSAFTQERLKFLNMLSSQIAVSIDNAKLYENLEQKVEERTIQLKKAQEENLKKAHRAGMADIAKETLHNVGNILNSIKTVADTVNQSTKKSALSVLTSANYLLRNHMDNLHQFILYNPKSSKLMDCYLALEQIFQEERDLMDRQLERLREKVDEIIKVVYTLHGHIGSDDTYIEDILLIEAVKFVLSTKQDRLIQSGIQVVEKYDKITVIRGQRAKLAYILDSLITNAREAMENSHSKKKALCIEIVSKNDFVSLYVSDNGVGISRENLKKIFFHGFTTKIGRFGHNLHNCANNMTEMGGTIHVESEGEGMGATFVLKFPAALD